MVETYVRLLLITPHSLFRPHFTVSSYVFFLRWTILMMQWHGIMPPWQCSLCMVCDLLWHKHFMFKVRYTTSRKNSDVFPLFIKLYRRWPKDLRLFWANLVSLCSYLRYWITGYFLYIGNPITYYIVPLYLIENLNLSNKSNDGTLILSVNISPLGREGHPVQQSF